MKRKIEEKSTDSDSEERGATSSLEASLNINTYRCSQNTPIHLLLSPIGKYCFQYMTQTHKENLIATEKYWIR